MKYGGLPPWRPVLTSHYSWFFHCRVWKSGRYFKWKWIPIHLWIKDSYSHLVHDVTKSNDKGSRHIKQLASLCLQCLPLGQRKLVQICHFSIVTTMAEDWYFEIPYGPSTSLSALCKFPFISVCWVYFCCCCSVLFCISCCKLACD